MTCRQETSAPEKLPAGCPARTMAVTHHHLPFDPHPKCIPPTPPAMGPRAPPDFEWDFLFSFAPEDAEKVNAIAELLRGAGKRVCTEPEEWAAVAKKTEYIVVWRTKTFWDTQTLSEEDVESHAFKKLEMRPAVHRSML